MFPRLPIDPYIPAIAGDLRQHRAVVVVAAPGAGKTTRVPPALVDDGPVILLQPRRVAARAVARRIAEERGWTLGREVGWHIRFERRFSRDTRLLVATEGILTARLQQDPLLSGFRTIVLDEFHERSIHADLGIALARQARRARDDLRIVVMSATLDAERVALFLDGCPVVDVPGTTHPLDIAYRPGMPIARAASEAHDSTTGHVLCFLPGAREIRDAVREMRRVIPASVEIVELHGAMPPDEQDAALTAAATPRIIVATNVAETSLTVPGVTAVVDSGWHKVARYDPRRGIDSLDLERIPSDSADQRAGRAGRLAPGLVRRLWSETDRLRPHREPDVHRLDLSGICLDVLAWGGDPATFEWFDPPPSEAIDAALALLYGLGGLEGRMLTDLGRAMSRMPLHPRLSRILLEAGGAFEAAVACALLSERQTLPFHPATTSCDLLAGDDPRGSAPHVLAHARELQRLAGSGRSHCSERELRRALFAGYPDRVARRRQPGDPRVLVSAGYGAVIGAESGVRGGEFVLALDVRAGRRGEQAEARIVIASLVEREWLVPDRMETVHTIGDDGVVRAAEREMYGAVVIRERSVPVDPAVAASLLADAYLSASLPDDDRRLLRRVRFAGLDVDLRAAALASAAGRVRLSDVRLTDGIDWQIRRRLDELAPASFRAPSGRTHSLDYREDGTVVLSIKLQELFGLAETPLVGSRHEPLLIELLAPNGRPVQTTRDLRSFWNTTYQDVRRELRGRYPKHPWPEDPWTAPPTARVRRSS